MAKSVLHSSQLGPSTSSQPSSSSSIPDDECSAAANFPSAAAEYSNSLGRIYATAQNRRPKMAAKLNKMAAPIFQSPFFISLLFFFLPVILALPRPGQVPIGGIFTLDREQGALEVQKVPGWLKAGDGKLFGIAQRKDVGMHQIQLNGRNVPIEVSENEKNICGPEHSTIWLEIVDPRRMGQLSIEEQFKSAQTLLGTLKDVGVRQEDIRIFPFSYLGEYRKVNEKIHELEENRKADDQLVFLLNISCGELTEQASEIINEVAENGLDFQVVQGTLRKANRQQQQTTTTTTQKPVDNLTEGTGNSSTTSAFLVSAILLIILLALVAGLVLYWLRNKQARKRRKQAAANAETNGKGSTRPGVLTGNEGAQKNATALSPDASLGTVTTPMLPDGDEAHKS